MQKSNDVCDGVNFFSSFQMFVQKPQRTLRLCAQENVVCHREASHSAIRALCSIAWCLTAGCKEEVCLQKSCIALFYYCNGFHFDKNTIYLKLISIFTGNNSDLLFLKVQEYNCYRVNRLYLYQAFLAPLQYPKHFTMASHSFTRTLIHTSMR